MVLRSKFFYSVEAGGVWKNVAFSVSIFIVILNLKHTKMEWSVVSSNWAVN